VKETQKQYTTRLEKELQQAKRELKEYKTLCNNLNAEILQMQERADKDYANSSDYSQMNKRVELLENKNELLESKNKSLNERVQNLINELESKKNNNDIHELIVEKQHNERGAGRKTRFTDQEKATIQMYRLQDKTIQELADMFCCSIGLIHKIINENKEKSDMYT
jgi:DNA-directed RNA polymerase specialized sigma24 family protein